MQSKIRDRKGFKLTTRDLEALNYIAHFNKQNCYPKVPNWSNFDNLFQGKPLNYFFHL